MADAPWMFEADEYQNRVARLQLQMDQRGLDALLLTTPADIFYVTGFLTRFWESPARPWFVVLPAMGDPVAVIPSIGADLMGRTWLTDIRTWPAPRPADEGVTLLSQTLAELVPECGQIGMPMGPETQLRMPLADYARLRAAITPRTLVDDMGALRHVREIKSEAEITKLRTICQIADRAFARLPGMAQGGQALRQVFRAFQAALLHEGADWVSYLAGAAGPDGYGDVISPAGAAQLQTGDILMLDTGAVRDGYFCDFDRNFAVGPASDPVRRTHAALWHATETALHTLRPGMRACDAHQIMADALCRHGVDPVAGRFGHGQGITLTEWPSLMPGDETELRAGMVLTLEPSAIVSSGRLLVHEENIVLRKDGPELLSNRAPEEMPQLSP